MNKKMIRTVGIFVTAAVISANASGVVVLADPENSVAETADLTNEIIPVGNVYVQAVMLYEKLSGTEIQVPEAMKQQAADIDGLMLKAVTMGYLNLGDVPYKLAEPSVLKQDMINMMYKAVIRYNPSLDITADEAAMILNECADNAELYDENRMAYAFMIKYGIIDRYVQTDPMKPLTYNGCSALFETVYDAFNQNIYIDINGKKITVGDSRDKLVSDMGMPTRIDHTEYGFEWYVYNSEYENFVMVGIENGLIRAFYSNAKNFNVGGVASGAPAEEANIYSDIEGLVFSMRDGAVDSVLYNTKYKQVVNNPDMAEAKEKEFLDIINAYRVKTNQGVFARDDKLDIDAEEGNILFKTGEADLIPENVHLYKAYDANEMYNLILENGIEGVFPDTGAVSGIGVDIAYEPGSNMVVSFKIDSESEIPWVKAEALEAEDEAVYKVEPVEKGSVPVILSPNGQAASNNGEPLRIELEDAVSDVYHIEILNEETRDLVMNSFITTDKNIIELPHEFFVGGAEYTMTLSAVTDNGELPAEKPVSFIYGTAEIGVEILTPQSGTVTDDDVIDLKWESSAYNDFCVSMYNQSGEVIASTYVYGEKEVLIQDVDPGIYALCVTAVKNNSDIPAAQAWTQIEIQDPVPVVTETIMNRDDVYYFIYEDDEGNVYFYDEDIVQVTEKGKEVDKKKIIQKKIKGTHNYRELAALQTRVESTTGVPVISNGATASGLALVEEAKKYLGIPYVWGGTTTKGFDCSGLMQYVFRQKGISISRTSREQFANDGVFVTKAELQPGDLVFFQKNGVIHHVGMYVGGGMMLHAPRTGQNVQIASMETDYYQNEYAGAKRITY